MNKIRRKITVSRFFQVLAYFLSIPLLVYLMYNASKALQEDPSFGKLAGYLPLLVGLGILVVVAITQLIVRGIFKKNRFARAAIVGLVTAVLLIGPVVAMDTLGKAEYEKSAKAINEKNGTKMMTYEKSATFYKQEIEKHSKKVNSWIEKYNLAGFEGSNKGAKNTDGVDSVEKDGAYYKPNGMYSDGYIFGLNDARKILHDYYVIGEKIQKNQIEGLENADKKSADVLLREELARLETDLSSDWNKYKSGVSESSINIEGFEYIVSNTEYADAYGPEGTAKKYYITPERLDAILGDLGNALSSENTPKFEELVNDIGGAISAIVGDSGIVGMILGLVTKLPPMMNAELNLQRIIDFVNSENLWSDSIKPLFDEAGTTELFGVPIEDTLTADFVYSLLSNLSYYQSSTTYPAMYFIENQALKDYAYAKYYGQRHGATIGSVLIPAPASNAKGVKMAVGKITLDSSGVEAPTAAEVKTDLLYFDNYESSGAKFYPLLAVRAVLLKFGGLAFFCLMLSYAFTQLIDNNYKKLKPVEA